MTKKLILYYKSPKGLQHKLRIMQNKIARFVLNLSPRCHIGPEELQKAGMISMDLRARQMRLNHVYNIFHDQCPNYLKSNFTRVNTHHQYHTRSSDMNFVTPGLDAAGQHTFFHDAIKDWNGLPQQIKNVKHKPLFKARVKEYLKSIS